MGSVLKVLESEPPSVEYCALDQSKPGKNKVGKRAREEEEEEFSEDAQVATKTLVVIKMKKWDLTLGSEGNALDFRKGKFKATLVFALDQSEVVERKGGTILTCKFAPSKNGTTCAVEVVIGVLSSQLGGLFRIMFSFEDKETVLSDVIKVVSKKSQLDKEEKPKRARTTQVATREAVLEMIEENREERKEQQSLLQQLATQQAEIMRRLETGNVALSSSMSSSGEGLSVMSNGDETPQFSSTQETCVESLRKSLQALSKFNPLQRQTAMKQLSENITQSEMAVFTEFYCYLNPPPPKDLDMEFDQILVDSDCRSKLQLSALEMW